MVPRYKAAAEAKSSEDKRSQESRRSALVLVLRFLADFGYMSARDMLEQESVSCFSVPHSRSLTHCLMTFLPHCPTTSLHYYHTASQSHHLTTALHYYLTTSLPQYVTTTLHYYLIPHYLTTPWPHYLTDSVARHWCRCLSLPPLAPPQPAMCRVYRSPSAMWLIT